MKRILALALVAAACGDTVTTSTAPPPPTTAVPSVTFDLPTGAGDVVLQIDVGVNQPDPLPVVQYGFPTFTLYGDGRLIATDREVESGALPGLIEARLAPEGVQALVAEAVDAGLLDPLEDYGDAQIGDADSTRFVLDVGDRESSFAVYAVTDTFGIEDPGQVAGRERLSAFLRSVREWRSIAGESVVEGPDLFTGDGVLLLARPGAVAPGSEVAPGVAWDPQSYDTRLGPLECQAIIGADYEALLPAITGAAGEWALSFRQIFPREAGCEILPGQ